MDWQATLLLLLHLFCPAATATPTRTPAAPPEPNPACPTTCGDVSIPYPFGIGDDCCLPGFNITCNSTIFKPPRPFLGRGNLQVLNISTVDGVVRINHFIGKDCNSPTGERTKHNQPFINLLEQAPYRLSSDRNKFVAIGCDTMATIVDQDKDFSKGCALICGEAKQLSNGSCSGIGCCEIQVPKGLWSFYVKMQSFRNHTDCDSFSPCSYAFLTDVDSFTFDTTYFKSLSDEKVRPLTLEWAIGKKTCEEDKAEACVAKHSECYNATSIEGYRCNCSAGFHGNPYLKDDKEGCQDINECENGPYPCTFEKACRNTEGSYKCMCPKAMKGDGRKDGTGCTVRFPYFTVVLATGLGLFFLTALLTWLYWARKKRELVALHEEYFRRNGGRLFKELAPALTEFSSEELSKATNNFSDDSILGRGGQSTVYRGDSLPQHGTVAIKKSKFTDENKIKQFFNEMQVVSVINHRHVVKLLGCCLETEVPLLVYEFVSNKTLSHHIHDPGCRGSLSWETRLKIALQASNALTHMHSYGRVPIIHRDVKSGNILLDDQFNAMVGDFGCSLLVPFDKNCINSLFQGTLGYLDPEYLSSGKFTDKSDVYSFGVVLVELLTGEEATSANGKGNLAKDFATAVEKGGLRETLEDRVAREGTEEQLNAIAGLATRCMRERGDDRPNMSVVHTEINNWSAGKNEIID